MSGSISLRESPATGAAPSQIPNTRISRWLVCGVLATLVACKSAPSDEGRIPPRDLGRPPDLAEPVDPMGCPSNQAFDRASNQCVSLPACSPIQLDVKFAKGPASPDGGSPWMPEVVAPTADLRAIFGTPEGDAWIVGSGGEILAWQGLAWLPQASGTTADLNALWAANPCRVWAAGQGGTLLQFDGSAWTSLTSGTPTTLHGVWGSDAYDVWVVGDSGTLLHFDGQLWSTVTTGTTRDLFAIWGTGHQNIWAAGQDGLLLHYDGSGWSEWASATSQTLRSIWGADTRHVWAVGNAGTVVFFDGRAWTSQISNTPQDLLSIHGAFPGSAWAVGGGGTLIDNQRGSWSTRTLGSQDWLGTWGGSLERRWAVGRSGSILAYRGDFSTAERGPTPGTSFLDARAVFGTATSNVWVTGLRGLIVRWDGTSWRAQRSGTGLPLVSVWGSDPSSAWTASDEHSSSFYRWNGSQWSPVPLGRATSVYGLWGSSANEIWASSSPILKWQGSAWVEDVAAPQRSAQLIFGLDAQHVWTHGGGLFIPPGQTLPPYPWRSEGWFWNGTKWNLESSSTYLSGWPEYKAMWASAPSNFWYVWSEVGSGRKVGKIWGGGLGGADSPGGQILHGISGSGPSNVFIVGDAGTLLRWNGATLSQQNINGYGGNLYAVWAADASHVWAVGDGVILQHE